MVTRTTLGAWEVPEPPPAPEPHPQPLVVATPGDYVTPAGIRSWGTLRRRLAPGWTMTERRAVGWSLGPKGARGPLVESIAIRFAYPLDVEPPYAPLTVRAVSVLSRPLDETTHDPTDAWGHDLSFAWVARLDGRAFTWPYEIGSRALTAALQVIPVLDEHDRWIAPKPRPKTTKGT